MKRMGIASALLLLSGISALVGCGSADAGANGVNALSRVVPEAAGKNCAAGGQAFQFGSDQNGNDVLDDAEVKGTSFVCNGTAGAAGAQGAQGEEGDAGAEGPQGDAGPQGPQGVQGDAGPQGAQGDAGAQGAPAPEPMLGQFLTTQVVKGAVLTCTSTSITATSIGCTGMKLDGVDVRLAPGEANVICNAIDGKAYLTANGASTVSSYMIWTGTTWAFSSAASRAPMQNLQCGR
ncbi:MAG: hypothetical protein QOI41_1486 [Myxococcales bacterium]|jgi:hypothetical protein|nr:hypothetical protein [Myxococcales bacterium]